MKYFEINKDSENHHYYEILDAMLDNWENEITEFKEAKSYFDTDKLGRYFSAISNEANLKQQQYGWIVFGIREKPQKSIVGAI